MQPRQRQTNANNNISMTSCHKGGIKCSANVFIVCEGANTKNCMWFSRKRFK